MKSESVSQRGLKPSRSTGDGAGAAAPTEATLAAAEVQSPRDALTKALEEQLRMPKYRTVAGAQDAARLANAMLGCLDPPELDFTRLPDADARLLATFPPGMWATLRQQAFAQSHCCITSVTLSAAMSTELVANAKHTLAEGMGQLHGLTHLIIVDPPAGTIDLATLGVMPESLTNVQIRCLAHPKRWELHVPKGAEVIATADSVALEKSVVFYWGRDGQCGEPRTLGGIIHDNQAKNWALAKMPREIMLNGVAEYVGHDEADPEQRKIWCRHLALHWLRARKENRSTDAPFDYGPFTKEDSLSAAMKPDLEDDFAGVVSAGADALFGPDHFGELLAQQFGRMQTGQTRQFVVNTPNHSLALELRVKTSEDENKCGAPLEYVVTLYDPNHTALHERLMVPNLDLLRKKGLGAWLPAASIAEYFPAEEGPPIASLYSLLEEGETKPEAPAADFLRHIPVEHRASPMVLYGAMLDGRPQVVGEILDLALKLSRSGEMGRAEVEQCIAANNGTVPGLAAALAFGHTTAVERYVGWILDTSSQILTPTQRMELLRAPCVDDQPGLHLTASEEAAEKYAARIAESVFGYVRAIVASPHLSAQDKATLCTAAHHGRTAAQAALASNNPMMAAAMVCAICDGESNPDTRADLLASLGVNLRDVLAAQTGKPYPGLEDWINIVERAT